MGSRRGQPGRTRWTRQTEGHTLSAVGRGDEPRTYTIDPGSFKVIPGTQMTGLLTTAYTNIEVPAARARRVFVAYPYSLPKADYRRPFKELAKAFNVEFQFADEKITNKQILDKITDMIQSARFSLFDITTWNANVALELGIAIGSARDYYLLFNPENPENPQGGEVPADLGGLDRIQYRSYAELEEGLTKLFVQEFGVLGEQERTDPVSDFRQRVPGILAAEPGLRIGEIADRLGVRVELAQVIVRPLVVSGDVETTGERKGTRYYLRGQGPKRPSARIGA